jgi:hypothetical protein
MPYSQRLGFSPCSVGCRKNAFFDEVFRSWFSRPENHQYFAAGFRGRGEIQQKTMF